jgi:hypothetical protein
MVGRLRAEIALRHFRGNSDYTLADVYIALSQLTGADAWSDAGAGHDRHHVGDHVGDHGGVGY